MGDAAKDLSVLVYVQLAPRQPALPCRPQPHAPRPPPRLAALCPSCLWPGFRRRAGRARKCASRWPRQSSTPWCVHACVRSCGSEPPATLPAAVGARNARRGGRQYGHKARGPRVGRMVASVSWGAACPQLTHAHPRRHAATLRQVDCKEAEITADKCVRAAVCTSPEPSAAQSMACCPLPSERSRKLEAHASTFPRLSVWFCGLGLCHARARSTPRAYRPACACACACTFDDNVSVPDASMRHAV